VSVVFAPARCSHTQEETDEEFDDRYEGFFNRSDIDGWEIRKAVNDLQGYDLVPEPKIVIAALKACRRVNDYALAVRFLEAVKVSLFSDCLLSSVSVYLIICKLMAAIYQEA